MKSATQTSSPTVATARGRESPVATTVGVSVAMSTRTTLPAHSQPITAAVPSPLSAIPQGPAHTAPCCVTWPVPTSTSATSPARWSDTSSTPGVTSTSARGSAPTAMVTRTASVVGSRTLTLP